MHTRKFAWVQFNAQNEEKKVPRQKMPKPNQSANWKKKKKPTVPNKRVSHRIPILAWHTGATVETKKILIECVIGTCIYTATVD